MLLAKPSVHFCSQLARWLGTRNKHFACVNNGTLKKLNIADHRWTEHTDKYKMKNAGKNYNFHYWIVKVRAKWLRTLTIKLSCWSYLQMKTKKAATEQDEQALFLPLGFSNRPITYSMVDVWICPSNPPCVIHPHCNEQNLRGKAKRITL